MVFMSKFGERLSELMCEQNIKPEELAKKLNVHQSTVRDWKRNNLVKLADSLKCSIDFLVGRSEILLDFTPRGCPPFYDRLREVMKKCKISRYRLVKKTGIEDTSFSQWKRGSVPFLLTLEKLADCLDVSIDCLVGRDR